jgi:hypothetical protein
MYNIEEASSSFIAFVDAIRYLHQNMVSNEADIKVIGKAVDALEVLSLCIRYFAEKHCTNSENKEEATKSDATPQETL